MERDRAARNARYVGANNNQRIAPYTLVNPGVSHKLGIGRITVFASNLFNTESGCFSTLQYAQPIALSGGGPLLQAAQSQPAAPVHRHYSFNTGARRRGFSRGARGGAGGGRPPRRRRARRSSAGLGFGQLKFVPPPAGADPLALATSRTECAADLQPLAPRRWASSAPRRRLRGRSDDPARRRPA